MMFRDKPIHLHFNVLGNLFCLFVLSEVTKELMLPGQQEGCSGTRNLEDNISDLKAQVAANNKVNFLIEIDMIRVFFFDSTFNSKRSYLKVFL